MNRKYFIGLISLILLAVGFYFYYLKPHQLAVVYCEKEYRYHPATSEQGAYHSAVGVSGPIAKYESMEQAMKMCIKYHTSFFREVGDIKI